MKILEAKRSDALDDKLIFLYITRLMNRYDPDPVHSRQVSRIALLLFDHLKTLHGFGADERNLLNYAALLHDTGWSISGRPHHKGSMDIILSDTTIPLTSHERLMVALIARYHRKSPPAPSHQKYSSLAICDQKVIRWTAAILRTSDALDRAHQSAVKDLTLEISENTLQILCSAEKRSDDSPPVSDEVFMRKASFLSDITGREVMLTWKYQSQM